LYRVHEFEFAKIESFGNLNKVFEIFFSIYNRVISILAIKKIAESIAEYISDKTHIH